MDPHSCRTLFLDRDGVINRRIVGGYVRNPDEFEFLPGALDAIRDLAAVFDRIIVVTNQQGIGKGQMTEEDLASVHKFMLSAIRAHGGRIDAIYHCPLLADEIPNCRKPSPAMARWAKRDFPEIEFSGAIMAGDTESDMIFANRLGMKAALVGDQEMKGDPKIDFRVGSLRELSLLLKKE